MRTTVSGCFTYPRNGRVSSSEAGHAVSTRACGYLADELVGGELVQDHIVAIQQRVFRSDAIRRRHKELHHEGSTSEGNPPSPMPDPPSHGGDAHQDDQRHNRKHVAGENGAAQ